MRNKHWFKRFLTLLLAAVMALSACPALAEEAQAPAETAEAAG